jgi:succinate dehydrogenase / fumarate reductase cytochrome b subunit
MANTDRPLSPHLQVYRWQLTMFLSITHRATGIALCGGVLLLMYWIWALTAGPDQYRQAIDFFGSIPGRTILFILTFCLVYHLCNGVRHLFWDIGKGLELESVYRSGWTVVVASAVLTLVIWIAAYAAN